MTELTPDESEVLGIILARYIQRTGEIEWRGKNNELVHLVDLGEKLLDGAPNRGDQ